ncbi:Ger(x)C family spore germination C-terminal domain-containing protein [Anaerobacillus sp. HL2]|nr:Ger(x)C family spore germination C-terminal domain-containing protein [Anaerobacillus sp. HL2]
MKKNRSSNRWNCCHSIRKWIGSLNKDETRGLLWVREEVEGGIIVIPSIDGKGKIGLEILGKGKIHIEPRLTNGQLTVKVIVEQLVSVAEVMTYIDLNEKKCRRNKAKRQKKW